MKKVLQNDLFREIIYEENFWTGKRSIIINGQPLQRLDKKTFKLVQTNSSNEETETIVRVCGNFLSSSYLMINDTQIEIYPSLFWYEYVLFVLPLLLNLIWGNSKTLCSIIPIVGGAIGGAISAVCCLIGVVVSREKDSPGYKVLVYILSLIISFLVCAAIGLIIVALFS